MIEEGNSCFKKGQFHLSISMYTKANVKADYKSKRALLNRSAAYLKLERYYQAFLDAQQAAQLDQNDEKCKLVILYHFIFLEEYFKIEFLYNFNIQYQTDKTDMKTTWDHPRAIEGHREPCMV